MDMNNEMALIEKYRRSDFGDRIFLSLAHRDLRSEFSAIDSADAKRGRDEAADQRRSNFSQHRWLHAMRKVWRNIFQAADQHRITTNKTII
jgi:hypothetical protein